jgi:hypothetical protein
MMPDYGCFTIAWTSYGIVLPSGWEHISIEELPVGANLISFSRRRTAEGILYDIEAKQDGWSFLLREKASPGARYFLNGRPTHPSVSGIRMEGRKNRVLITS